MREIIRKSPYCTALPTAGTMASSRKIEPRPRLYFVVAHFLLLFLQTSGILLPEDTPILSGDLRDRVGGKSNNSPRGSETASSVDEQHGLYPASPPRIYKTLAQRPIGRHVLAGSSLFAECVRVYAPSPLSSIWTGLGRILFVHEVGGSTEGESSRPGMTYDQFMSNSDRSDEEDRPEEELVSPSDKYRRVSSSFLVRHGIGSFDSTSRSPSLPRVVYHESATPTTGTPHSPTSGTGAFSFKPLSSLRITRRPVEDDLDLLSDSGEDKLVCDILVGDETSEQTGDGRARRHTRTIKGGDHGDWSAEPRAHGAAQSQTSGRTDPARVLGTKRRARRSGRSKNSSARSLISADDDTDIALIRKLKGAALGHENKSSV